MENIKNNSKEIIATFLDIENSASKYLFSNFDKYRKIMKPINDWTKSIRNEVMRVNPKLHSYSEVKSFLQWQDGQLVRLIREETPENKQEIEAKRKELLTVFEDDEYLIKSILDYDYGETIWKMPIEYKPLNYRYREDFIISNW